jgi:hypothetical protein
VLGTDFIPGVSMAVAGVGIICPRGGCPGGRVIRVILSVMVVVLLVVSFPRGGICTEQPFQFFLGLIPVIVVLGVRIGMPMGISL